MSFDKLWDSAVKIFAQIEAPYDSLNYKLEQSCNELKLFYPYVEQLRPKRLLEIGAFHGGSLYFWIHAADDDAEIVVIDIDPKTSKRAELWRSWLKQGQRLTVIVRDSRDPEALNEVKNVLRGEKLDFLFIDGNHEMPTPKMDYENYAPLVREGGIVALHDVGGPPNNNLPGLEAYWESLRDHIVENTYWKTIEFFCRSPTAGPLGIGVIIKG